MNSYDNSVFCSKLLFHILNIIIIILSISILYLIFFNEENFAGVKCVEPDTIVNIPDGCKFNSVCNKNVSGICNGKEVSYNVINCKKKDKKYQIKLDQDNNLVCDPRVCKLGATLTKENTCIKCNNGYTLLNDECVTCKNGTISGNVCVSKCNPMTINGKVVATSVLNSDNSCKYTLSGNICPISYTGTDCSTKNPTCSKGSFDSKLNICTVSSTISGYTCTVDSRVCTNDILPGYNKNSEPLICPIGYKIVNSSCEINYDSDLKINSDNKLEYKCSLDSIYNKTTDKCEKRKVECKSGYTLKQTTKGGRSYCIKSGCAPDEKLLTTGMCQKICPLGYNYQKTDKSYICNPICPDNFKVSNISDTNKTCISQGVCSNTDYLSFDSKTTKCVMPSLTNLTDATHNVKKYVCPLGFQAINNTKLCSDNGYVNTLKTGVIKV